MGRVEIDFVPMVGCSTVIYTTVLIRRPPGNRRQISGLRVPALAAFQQFLALMTWRKGKVSISLGEDLSLRPVVLIIV